LNISREGDSTISLGSLGCMPSLELLFEPRAIFRERQMA